MAFKMKGNPMARNYGAPFKVGPGNRGGSSEPLATKYIYKPIAKKIKNVAKSLDSYFRSDKNSTSSNKGMRYDNKV